MPTPCQVTSGFTLGCRDNVGSIKNIYILSGSITNVSSSSEGLVSNISGSGQFFKFELFRETSDYGETMTVTPENGTIMYEQTVNAVFFKLQVSTRNQVRLLSGNPNIKMIVETNNGGNDSQYILVGKDYGAQLVTSAGSTGTGFGDRNGYQLTFTAREIDAAPFISASTSASLGARMSGITVQA